MRRLLTNFSAVSQFSYIDIEGKIYVAWAN